MGQVDGTEINDFEIDDSKREISVNSMYHQVIITLIKHTFLHLMRNQLAGDYKGGTKRLCTFCGRVTFSFLVIVVPLLEPGKVMLFNHFFPSTSTIAKCS